MSSADATPRAGALAPTTDAPPPRSCAGAAMPGACWATVAIKLLAICGLAALVLVPHYRIPATADNMALHEIHRHILYLPILLAAFWFGCAGGVAAALAISVIYFPHLFVHWHGTHPTGHLTCLLAVVTYLLAGGGTGYLIDRLRREQARLRGANARLGEQSEQLREAMGRLTEQTREVFEAEEQLRRADRLSALGQLTTGLAHELRNPLGSIRGAAEILGDAGTATTQRAEFSRILIEEADRLDHVLGSFLDYARTQKIEGAAAADLRKTLDKVLTLLGKQLDKAGIAVESRVGAELPMLRVSESLLQQVLLNLLLNAVQAMPRGGRIAIEAQEACPAPTARAAEAGGNGGEANGERNGSIVRVTIADTGPGVPAEFAERIFDPFFTTKPQGSGLGLSIVHKIIDSQAGTIRLDREYRGGAKFAVELPVT